MTDTIKKLKQLQEKISTDTQFKDLCNIVLNNPVFTVCSGAAKKEHHHYGDGGLATHTLEVIELMLSSKKTLNLKEPKDELIFLAGLYHDLGKCWDYKKDYGPTTNHNEKTWQGTLHKREIHHISRSSIEWNKAADLCDLNKKYLISEEVDTITHAILSHHGQREWGSPVAPNTRLAWLLHLCDSISARMDDCNKHDILSH